MADFDKILFGNKKFSDILEEIYNNQKKKEQQVYVLVQELKGLVKEIGDATLIVPLIKDYMDIGLKNDEQLIKLASIVQKLMISENKQESFDGVLTDEEKQMLLDSIDPTKKSKKK
jgi:hypothetical protein